MMSLGVLISMSCFLYFMCLYPGTSAYNGRIYQYGTYNFSLLATLRLHPAHPTSNTKITRVLGRDLYHAIKTPKKYLPEINIFANKFNKWQC